LVAAQGRANVEIMAGWPKDCFKGEEKRRFGASTPGELGKTGHSADRDTRTASDPQAHMLLFLRTFPFAFWQLDASLTLPALVRRCSRKDQPDGSRGQKIRRIHAISLSGLSPFPAIFAHAACGFSSLPPLLEDFREIVANC
jgi:hypothetical protein